MEREVGVSVGVVSLDYGEYEFVYVPRLWKSFCVLLDDLNVGVSLGSGNYDMLKRREEKMPASIVCVEKILWSVFARE